MMEKNGKSTPPGHWLMKTEPEVFSFDDLTERKGRTTHWEGVRNYQARNLMRDELKQGDQAFIYHSGIDEPAIQGIAEIVREGYPDPTALDPKSEYYDQAAHKKGESPWIMVDVRATHRFKIAVTREMLKAQPGLKKMMVLQKGARLSVQPVTETEFKIIVGLGKPEKL
jgi:predicted RNA-binding protein with PUA-like domain